MFWRKNKSKKREKIIIKEPEKEFISWKRKLLRMSIISFLVTFIAILIVGMKFFYPFHVVIGLGVYIISYIPFIKRIVLSRKTWKKYHYYKFTEKFFKKEKRRLILVILLSVFIIVFFWLRPLDEKPFAGLTDEQVKQMIADDMHLSVTAMDYLETTGNTLLTRLENKESNIFTQNEILNSFEEFLKAVSFSESLTDKHRYFASLSYSLWEERVSSFLISYSLYIKKYEIVHRIMTTVTGSELQKKTLNQYNVFAGRNNIYNEMVTRFYQPKTRLRLTLGYLYMRVFATPNEDRGDEFGLLNQKAISSYSYLRSNFISTLSHTGEVLLDDSERKIFEVWFPIQKGVANAMGHTILTARGEEGFITTEQALEMGKMLEPGDIVLQRRNWHLSNVGIPGFYSHAALYTGGLEKMNEYFASEFPYFGFNKFSEYIENKFPVIYKAYLKEDDKGYTGEVMEAIEPGVILQSLSKSLDADFVVALRPNLLSKKDKLLALISAFEEFGKPYDYNFDFDTTDTLVCSELVYNSYAERLPLKKGIHFSVPMMSGRRMLTPLNIAEKFIKEKGIDQPELSFVYFLKGNEKTQQSRVATEAEFIETVSWSKFSFMQQ
jgi:hypothetical protein